MKTSEQIDKISEALAFAQGEIVAPEKNRTAVIPMKAGGSYSFNYADLAAMFESVRVAFAKYGVAHTTSIVREPDGLVLIGRLVHSSGQWFQSEVPLPHCEDPKVLAANITYLTRYLFTALAGGAADEELDGEPEHGAVYSNRKPDLAPSGAKPPVAPKKDATPKKEAAKSGPTRKENGDAIIAAMKILSLKPAELAEWALNKFGEADMTKLTDAQLGDFRADLEKDAAEQKKAM